jgi:hypothetical protein
VAGRHTKADFLFSPSSTVTTPTSGEVTAPSGDSTIDFYEKVKQAKRNIAPATIDFGAFVLLDKGIATTYTDNYSIDYTIEVTVTEGSGKIIMGSPPAPAGTFDISGTLSGFIQDANGVFSSSFTNTYNSPLSQTQTIGDSVVTLSLDNTGTFFVQPSSPSGAGGSSATIGTFSANVTATPAVTPAPEPASLTLLGLSSLGLLGYGRRRRKQEAA